MCPLPLEFPSHFPPHPSPLGCHRSPSLNSASYSKFPLAICFTHGNVHVLMFLSQFIPPSPSLTISTKLFCMWVSPLLPFRLVPQYHLSRFHIYALIYDICFSLSDLTSVCTVGSRFIQFVPLTSIVLPPL